MSAKRQQEWLKCWCSGFKLMPGCDQPKDFWCFHGSDRNCGCLSVFK